MNVFKDKVYLEVKTETQSALGQTEVWKPVQSLYARVVPISNQTKLQYQQLKSNVTHQIIMGGIVTVNSNYRFRWLNKILTPIEPPKYINNMTTIMVSECMSN